MTSKERNDRETEKKNPISEKNFKNQVKNHQQRKRNCKRL